VAVDVTLTPDLTREGLARDLVRRIQTLRKEADFQLSDRITTFVDADNEMQAVVAEWGDYIKAETLSLELVAGPVPHEAEAHASLQLDGKPVSVGVRRL
jgi:isoleucyl-tRNA synthetase